jgi:8-oxo-dGTP diphosphatase
MSDRKTTRLEFSAGGVLYRIVDSRLEILVIEPKNGVFALPKGLIEKGEKPEEAAVREVKEETGCLGEIEDFLGKVEYWYVLEGIRIHKFVYYYLMKYVSGDPSRHDSEVLSARWVPAEEVLSLLKFKNEREIIGKALSKIKG